jgi:hypothetical protein
MKKDSLEFADDEIWGETYISILHLEEQSWVGRSEMFKIANDSLVSPDYSFFEGF